MSIFISVVIIVLAMLIQGLLQLTPGIFSIFYHSALGKLSAKKTDNLSLSFILGVECYLAIMLLSVFFIVNFLLSYLVSYSTIFWVLSSLSFTMALLFFLLYFRKSTATALFISRRTAKNLDLRATTAKSRLDAFALGFFSGVPELVFTLPLFVILIFAMSYIPGLTSTLILLPYIIIVITPLFTIRTLFRTGSNLASITRLRTKLKPLIRWAITISFLLIAFGLIYLGAIYG